MGLARLRNNVGNYIWFASFFMIIILVWAVGFSPKVADTRWPDRLWYLVFLVPFTGIAAMVNVGEQVGRFFHTVLTVVLLLLFLGVWGVTLLPGFITANNQPDELSIPGINQGGTCANPFNDPAWYCVYNNTAEAQLCDPPAGVTPEFCAMGHDLFNLSPAFPHFWLFIFGGVFILFLILDLVLFNVIHTLVMRARKEIDLGLVENRSTGIGVELRDWTQHGVTQQPYTPGPLKSGDVRQRQSASVSPMTDETRKGLVTRLLDFDYV